MCAASGGLQVEPQQKGLPAGMGLRVAISIAVVFGWIVFALLHAAFFAEDFTLFQNIVIIIVALLIGIAILGISWASWGLKFSRQWWEPPKPPS